MVKRIGLIALCVTWITALAVTGCDSSGKETAGATANEQALKGSVTSTAGSCPCAKRADGQCPCAKSGGPGECPHAKARRGECGCSKHGDGACPHAQGDGKPCPYAKGGATEGVAPVADSAGRCPHANGQCPRSAGGCPHAANANR